MADTDTFYQECCKEFPVEFVKKCETKGKTKKNCPLDNCVSIISSKIPKISKSIRFNIKKPIVGFTGRAKELQDIHDELNKKETTQPSNVSIVGLDGIGKTEIARMYIQMYGEKYSYIAWLHSELYTSIRDSIISLAKDLKIPHIETDNTKKLLENIYNIFNGKGLIVFDNAQKFENIETFLPTAISAQYSDISVIITSRNRNWSKTRNCHIKVIDLYTFSKKESHDFIKGALDLNYEEDGEYIKKLAEKMHYLPLAIYQVVAYIKMRRYSENLGNNYEIKHFLNEFSLKPKDCLDYSGTDRHYLETVYTIFTMTIEHIHEYKSDLAKLVIQIIKVMAYLSPDHIENMKCFRGQFLHIENEELAKSIEILKEYSLIRVEEGWTSIHRLMQQVIRLKLKESGENVNILKRCVQVVIPDKFALVYGPFSAKLKPNNIYDVNWNNKLFVLSHACESEELIKYFEEKNIPSFDLISKTVHWLIHFNKSKDQAHLLDIFFRNVGVNYIDKNGNSLLFVATQKGRFDVVEHLLNLKADVNLGNNNKQSPLIYAAKSGNWMKVRKLVASKANVNHIDNSGMSALIYATHGINELMTALMISFAKGHKACLERNIKLDLKSQLPIFDRIESNITKLSRSQNYKNIAKFPLQTSAICQRFKIIKCLVENGADVNQLVYERDEPLLSLVKDLLERDVENSEVLSNHDFETMKYFLRNCARKEIYINARHSIELYLSEQNFLR